MFRIATCLLQYHSCLAGNGNLKQVKVVFTLSEREREYNVDLDGFSRKLNVLFVLTDGKIKRNIRIRIRFV